MNRFLEITICFVLLASYLVYPIHDALHFHGNCQSGCAHVHDHSSCGHNHHEGPKLKEFSLDQHQCLLCQHNLDSFGSESVNEHSRNIFICNTLTNLEIKSNLLSSSQGSHLQRGPPLAQFFEIA